MQQQRFLKYCLCLLVLFVAVPHAAHAQREPVLVIEGGTLIDGNGGAPVEDAVVIVRGNRIERVTTRGEARYPRDARVLDASGKYIVPGLMDAHAHYAEWMAELNLHFGVTSIFSIGSGGEWALAQRDAINAGKIPGPRTFVAVGSLSGARISALSARSGAGMQGWLDWIRQRILASSATPV